MRASRPEHPTRSTLLATVTILIALAMAASAQAQEVVEYYGTDALGSVRVVFDATGAIVARADYLPYGEEVTAAGPMPAEHFTGQARDAEAGMDYFHARQYQPRSGRFNAVDPVYAGLFDPQQWNRYAYARNNAMLFVDPSGMEICDSAKGEAKWCPPNSGPRNPYDVEFDRPGTVTPGLLGPTSSNIAMGEFRYEEQYLQSWVKPVAPGTPLVTLDSESRGRVNTSTFGTIEGEDGQPEVVFREGKALDPMVQLALGIDERAGRAGEPRFYAEFLITSAVIGGWYQTGFEIAVGSGRVAPFGNRTGHSFGRFPHYHRPFPGPGGGIGRHRPWQPPPTGAPWWRRF